MVCMMNFGSTELGRTEAVAVMYMEYNVKEEMKFFFRKTLQRESSRTKMTDTCMRRKSCKWDRIGSSW